MASIPPTAKTFADALDPNEILDFVFELQGVLEPGEAIDPSNWTLEVLMEGVALGLEIMDDIDRAPALEDDDQAIKFWLRIDDAFKDNPAFDGAGTELPLRATGRTTSEPYRIRQRTAKVRVAHQ